MDRLPSTSEYVDMQEWWLKSKDILKKNIKETVNKNTDKDLLETMEYLLGLIEKMKVKKTQ